MILAILLLVLSSSILSIESVGADSTTPSNRPETNFIFPRSNVEPIHEVQLLTLDAQTLWQARNEIYARKGYMFQSSRATSFFSNLPYYSAHKKQVMLNRVEKMNIALIRRFEEYIKKAPDLEFESSYIVTGLIDSHRGNISVRTCPSAECQAIGNLYNGCIVHNDYRMNKNQWFYAVSSKCKGEKGPSGGYIPRKYLTLFAG